MYPTRHLMNMHPLAWAGAHPLPILAFIGLFAGFFLLQKAEALAERKKAELLPEHRQKGAGTIKAVSFIGFFLVIGGLALMMHGLLNH